MEEALHRAGRSLTEVTWVAVTKNVSPEVIRQAWDCGLRHFGENRVQEVQRKWLDPSGRRFLEDVTLHMLGHLQTNKSKPAARLFDSLQSLDGLPLAQMLSRECVAREKTLDCLIEVKVSEEPTKTGVSPEALGLLMAEVLAHPALRVRGFMTLAPYSDDPEKSRPYFRKLRELAEIHRGSFSGERPVLSMGMSHDFEVALEEGATMVRIGTALFGDRPAIHKG